MSILTERRFVSVCVGLIAGALLLHFGFGFNLNDPAFRIVKIDSPTLAVLLYFSYSVMLFTTPGWLSLFVLTSYYNYGWRPKTKHATGKLPPYPAPETRDSLFLVMGERHHDRTMEPSETPCWITIPERGLFTGIAIFGAIGSGKTAGTMYPFAQQILGYKPGDPDQKLSALILEVKGDFCFEVQKILRQYGRSSDYLELNISAPDQNPFRYNPLHNDMSPYAQAYGMASLMTNLFGAGKDPFWQQAYTDLLTFVINLLRTVEGYATLYDVYRYCAFAGPFMDALARGLPMFIGREWVIVPKSLIAEKEELSKFAWETFVENPAMFKAPATEQLLHALDALGIEPEDTLHESPSSDDLRRIEIFRAIAEWYGGHWRTMDSKTRAAIVEGITVVLARFADNPEAKYIFCPPKECYDVDGANKRRPDGTRPHGEPFPPFRDSIEQGKVVALNLPMFLDPGMAGLIGALVKMDFQRAMLGRIPLMAKEPERHFRPVLFLCDEYQSFATTGGRNPSGDDKFFAMSRQTRCIPIVATQSVCSLRAVLSGDETWRVLLASLRSKLFLSMTDHSDMQLAADVFGKEPVMRENYTVAESGADSNISPVSGRMTGKQSSVTVSKSYSTQIDHRFPPTLFGELPNFVGVLSGYDGSTPFPPTYVYLKPAYLEDRISMTWFEQREAGLL